MTYNLEINIPGLWTIIRYEKEKKNYIYLKSSEEIIECWLISFFGVGESRSMLLMIGDDNCFLICKELINYKNLASRWSFVNLEP